MSQLLVDGECEKRVAVEAIKRVNDIVSGNLFIQLDILRVLLTGMN